MEIRISEKEIENEILNQTREKYGNSQEIIDKFKNSKKTKEIIRMEIERNIRDNLYDIANAILNDMIG
jgi:cobalamin biosynthesis protein CbiD